MNTSNQIIFEIMTRVAHSLNYDTSNSELVDFFFFFGNFRRKNKINMGSIFSHLSGASDNIDTYLYGSLLLISVITAVLYIILWLVERSVRVFVSKFSYRFPKWEEKWDRMIVFLPISPPFMIWVKIYDFFNIHEFRNFLLSFWTCCHFHFSSTSLSTYREDFLFSLNR
jgi:hypothetical protein